MRNLTGRVALVTGATGGIGPHLVDRLCAEKMRLIVSGRNADRLAALVGRVHSAGGTAVAVPADLAAPGGAAALAAAAERAFGAVDLLVHAAGTDRLARFSQQPPAGITEQLALDLTGPLLLVRALLPGMTARRLGHVVVIGSLAAVLGGAHQVPYVAAKAGLTAAVRGLRAEQRVVGVSAVLPGPVAGDGIYARRARRGHRVPRLVGTTTPEAVADGVLRAVRDNRPQVVVAPRRLHAAAMLAGVSPRATELAVRISGISRWSASLAGRER